MTHIDYHSHFLLSSSLASLLPLPCSQPCAMALVTAQLGALQKCTLAAVGDATRELHTRLSDSQAHHTAVMEYTVEQQRQALLRNILVKKELANCMVDATTVEDARNLYLAYRWATIASPPSDLHVHELVMQRMAPQTRNIRMDYASEEGKVIVYVEETDGAAVIWHKDLDPDGFYSTTGYQRFRDGFTQKLGTWKWKPNGRVLHKKIKRTRKSTSWVPYRKF